MQAVRSAWRPCVSSESERVIAHEKPTKQILLLSATSPQTGSLQMLEVVATETYRTRVGRAQHAEGSEDQNQDGRAHPESPSAPFVFAQLGEGT